MNRRMLGLYAGCTLAGLGLGIVEAGKWLRTLSVPGSPWSSAFDLIRECAGIPALLIVVGVVAAASSVAAVLVPGKTVSVLVRSVLVAVGALLAGRGIIAFSAPFSYAPVVYLPAFTLVLALSAGLLFYVMGPVDARSIRGCSIRGILIAGGWAVLLVALRIASLGSGRLSFGGFGTFGALGMPVEIRSFPILIQDLTGGAVCGAFVGAAVARLVAGRRLIHGAAWGAASGAWISGVLFAAHSVAAAAIMQSAYSERVALWSSLALCPLAGVVIAVGLAIITSRAPAGRTFRLLAGSVAALLIIAAAGYVVDARAGTKFYLAALNRSAYRTRVYIHFHKEGGWSRTLESNSDEDKIALCDRLIRSYPRNVYAAEALYLKAKCQFASWRFHDAAATLETLHRRFPDSGGASTLLLAHSYLAQGRFESVLSDFGQSDWAFKHWRGKDGAQLIGHACESIGRPGAAFFLYNSYIRNLTDNRRDVGAWMLPAVEHAEAMVSFVRPPNTGVSERATVQGRVLLDAHPQEDVYIALVQPHRDASSPNDSREFTGALTVPLWFGLGAVTGADGSFVIRNVPYGEYEVVVGFDAGRLPAGRVVSRAIAALQVRCPRVTQPDISFVPSIRPVRPLDGIGTELAPTLAWRPYPQAAWYSVSIIARPTLSLGRASGESYTCWMRSRIAGNSVKVTPDGFVANDESVAKSLVPDRRYMWMVFAYNKDGNVISSSEHYRLDSEPVFIALSNHTKGR